MRLFRQLDAYGREVAAIPRLIKQRSYSAYGEDSVFFLALNPGRRGFYVDVGAHHPKFGSNTFRLYRRGWSGLAIEPNPEIAKDFQRMRPRDTFIGEGVSEECGALTYYRFGNSVYNTFSAEREAFLRNIGEPVVPALEVKTRPLSEMLALHCPEKPIDLLSVDCEGFDLTVLQTADLATTRPTAVLVEDFAGLNVFRTETGASEIAGFLRGQDYEPIAQILYSTLYVSRHWRDLIKRSAAYDVASLRPDMLPR